MKPVDCLFGRASPVRKHKEKAAESTKKRQETREPRPETLLFNTSQPQPFRLFCALPAAAGRNLQDPDSE